ncbi:hypothetical protein A3C26_04175 [Candidatus Daviesbacteria bacterium RIFCSPHIGHO2_02_FULL_39_12]|uniref:DoxX family protein n=2 Tax=Candidatus Daviesiibacteriota TaxID=1752718 RepID=A0A1F5JB87_9BACT|nr:MAG: hypothetical protein A3C26_04175 [Candidatus Daviesbacteria bacterium RIFCSPHIGHO2_02_FULL_39_12]OGE72470.1 MAG: hypothetical protein A3H40_04480 [Candidatus Daviesbacteria bacterium RIFCSPLOWO2_02_FULL_38_15]
MSNRNFFYGLILILLAHGLIWLRSSYGKLAGGRFVDELGKTLTFFAGKNPYPFVKDFLTNTAIPNSKLFANLTMWGELLSALAIIAGASILLIKKSWDKKAAAVLISGLLGGMFLNAVFWLSSGWTSPSAENINLIMFATQLIGAAALFRNLISG